MKTKSKKELITEFFIKNPIHKFNKKSEPSAIAYEKFSNKTPDVSFSYFNRIFNLINLNTLPDVLTLKTLCSVIDNYPTKHKHGFIRSEIDTLLKKYKINTTKFNTNLGMNTCMIIDGDIITYHSDIELALKCTLRGTKKNVFEWD